MATVTKYPQSNAAITTGWANPTNAYADNGSYATAAPGKNSSIVSDYYNFNFGIPAGATINSVTFEFQYKASTGSSNGVITIQPILDTTLRGTALSGNQAATVDTTESSSLAGDWSLSELNDNTQAGGFKIRLTGSRGSSNTAVTRSVDYIKVTVDYTPPVIGGGSNVTLIIADGGLGRKTALLGSSASCVVSVQGSGRKISLGSSSAISILSAQSGGEVVISSKEGGGDVLFIVEAVVAGAAVRQGSGCAAIDVSTDGIGLSVRQGSNDSTILLPGQGSGLSIRIGSGDTTFLVNTNGAGEVVDQDVPPLFMGGSETAAILSTQGAGLKISATSDESVTVVMVCAGGEKSGDGSASTIVIFSAEGDGENAGIISGGLTASIFMATQGGGYLFIKVRRSYQVLRIIKRKKRR